MITLFRRAPFSDRLWAVAACWIAVTGRIHAQAVNTVRDNEFRSRWADYQVDRPQSQNSTDPTGQADAADQTGLLDAFSRTFADYFRNGPLQTRATLSTGWEYSNENILLNRRDFTDNSAFLAPGIGFFYNNQRGPLTISARYSAGYVYYLDQSYVAAGDAGGIFSNTGGLDISVEGLRSTLTSSTSYSSGTGNDIESGVQRTQTDISETFTSSYLLTTFARVGVTGNVSYDKYSGGGLSGTDLLSDTATLYVEYAYSPKTRGRLELSAGQQFQSISGQASSNDSNSADRYYYQALLSADYLPTPKLTFTVGAGWGVQEDSSVLGRARSGGHPIYRITVQYAPTPKTTASMRFGYEGVDIAPSLGLQVDWLFRATTTASVSLYQDNNFSTYLVDQSILTRGALLSVSQRFFGRVSVGLSGGVEQNEGYGRLVPGQLPYSEEPFAFGGVSLEWELSRYLAVDSYYRIYSGGSAVTQQNGLQSRASVSLRLTF